MAKYAKYARNTKGRKDTKRVEKDTVAPAASSFPKNSREKKAGQESGGLARSLYDLLGTLLVALTILLLLMTFFYRQVTVSGPSMEDTLHDKDRLLVSSFLYQPQNGDIVIITHGAMLDELIVKRVIAVEGQHLAIDYEKNEVSVNGKVLKEDYIKGRTIALSHPTKIPEVIPKGYVFVMGDNRENSKDSRTTSIDLIPVENVVGKAIFRWYPFDRLGVV